MYQYTAIVNRVIDGDTVDVTIHLGFKVTMHARLRILDLDTPETRTRNLTEKKHGLEAKDLAKQLMPVDSLITIDTRKTGKYGRYLAKITLSNGADFATTMKESGFQKKSSYI